MSGVCHLSMLMHAGPPLVAPVTWDGAFTSDICLHCKTI